MDFEHADQLNEAIRAVAMRHRALAGALLAPLGLHPGQEILLLALERGAERRRLVLELLDSATDADGVHILELTAGLESIPGRRLKPSRAEHKISWPCSTEQLKQHINTALTSRLLVDGTA